jgi:hypothetical protein
MAKEYSSVRPKIALPLAELQYSLESACLPGIPKNSKLLRKRTP